MLGEGGLLRRSWESALKRWRVGSGGTVESTSEDEEPEVTSLPARQTTRRRRKRKSRSAKKRAVETPTLGAKSGVIEPEELIEVMRNVPIRYADCSWERLFSTSVDGVSLGTFYRRMEDVDRPVVVLVRDKKGGCFGCYGDPWRIEKAYYGNGEAFVFTIRPRLQVWRWAKKNSYFQLGTHDSIAMGGGGKFALYFDSMFERGSSGECETFDNECLASSPNFEVVVLEAWTLVPRLSMDRRPSVS